MRFQEKNLGQLRPSSTTNQTIYTVPSGITVVVKSIVIANTAATAAKYRLFQCETGATFDQTTALAFDVELASGAKDVINLFSPSHTEAATFGVGTDSANALTFTLYGVEIGEQAGTTPGTTMNSFFITDGSTTDEITDQETITYSGTDGVDLSINATNSIQGKLNITSLTADATPDLAADYVAVYDASATGYKKVLLNKIGGGTTLYNDNGTLDGARAVDMDSNTLGFTNASAGVSIGTATADASAILDLTSTTEGFLKPRMTGAQVEAIGSPATGLEVYATNAGSGDVTIAGWWVYNGSNWIPSGAGLTQEHDSQIQRYTESGGASVEFDDYDAGSYNVLFLDPGSHDRDFTGIVAPATGVNRIIKIVNVGTNKKLKLSHQLLKYCYITFNLNLQTVDSLEIFVLYMDFYALYFNP